MVKTMKEKWLIALVALAALAPALSRAEHDCWMPSAQHVNIYSNMLGAAEVATGYRSRAEEAYGVWKKAHDDLAARAGDLAALQTEYQTLVEDYRRAQSTARASLINEPDNLRNLRNSLVSITGRVDVLKGRIEGLTGGDGWAAAARRCQDAAREFEEYATAFADKDTEAQRLRLSGIKWECVLNLYRENFMAIKTRLETIRKNLETGVKEVGRDEDAAKKAESDIRSRLTEIAALPAQIADNLGVKGVSTASGLLEVLADWSAPRVTVRFRSQGIVVADGEKLLKRGITPLARPPDPMRPGLVFLYWRNASTRDKFPDSGWDRPVEDNLDLEAVWGFEVRVVGLDRVFPVVMESEGAHPSLAPVFADSEFIRFRENPRPAPPAGQRLAGWQDVETKLRVDEGTLISKNMTLAPVYEEIRHTITWQDADGGFLNETTATHSSPPKPQKLPEDHDGFHYTHWSLEPDGEKWNGWGRPLDADLVLFAVRDADYIVRFCVKGGTEIAQKGFKKGLAFSPTLAPEPPAKKGVVFVAWTDASGADFSGRTIDSDIQLFAGYRDETPAETIERIVEPVRARFPLPMLIGADVALLVVLLVLLSAGRKPRMSRSGTAPLAVEDANAAATESATEGAAAQAGEAAAKDGQTETVASAILPLAALAAEAGTPLTAGVLAYPLLALVFVVLSILDVCIIGSKIGKAFGRLVSMLANRRSAASGGGSTPGAYVPPEKETCPTCGADLVDGECPEGHTIVRCSKCSAIMKDGVCPRCGVGGEQEFCPTCNSELVDGECPRGHTIVRCPDCGSILSEGVCPKGCNADPLNLGWPGGAERKLGAYALEVIACPKSEGAGFALRVPDDFVMGRSATDAKEPFVELLTITRKEKAQCSRQYVRMTLDADGAAFTVTLLNSSRNPAFVEGKKLVMQNDTAKLPLGGHIKLNPGYELALVEAKQEEG